MKKIARITLFTILMLVLVFGIYAVVHKIKQKKQIEQNLVTLPSFQLQRIGVPGVVTSDSIKKFNRKYVLFFNSECEHCQYEITNICNNITKFHDAIFLLISNENAATLNKFYQARQLEKYPIYLASDPDYNINKKFGAFSFPSTFIYDKEDKLLKKISGEVKIELLVGG